MVSRVPTELSRLENLKGLFTQYHTNVKENRRYYDLDFRDLVEPPPSEDGSNDIHAVMATTARRAIDDPADHILPTPRIRIPVRPTERPTVDGQSSAEVKRDFVSAWWDQEEEQYGVLAAARKVMLNEGRVCVRKTLRWELIPDAPANDATPAEKAKFRRSMGKLGQYGFLWNVELLDNLSVYEDPSNPRDPRWVFVEYDILAGEAEALFGQRDFIPTDEFSTVTYTEYWSKPSHNLDGSYTPGKFVQFINNETVHSTDNPYPYVPIAIEDSGFGLAFNTAKPHERYVGITQFAHDIFVAESRQMTTMENVAEITGFSPVVTRNFPEEKTISLGPRAVIPLQGAKGQPEAEDLEAFTWPAVPVTVVQMLEKTGNMAAETLKFSILGGIAQSGVETATEADQGLRSAAAKLQGPVLGLTRLVNKLSRWVLMDVDEVIKSKVTVYGTNPNGSGDALTIGPRDIQGFYTVSSTLSTTDEDAIELTKARFWLDAHNASPFLSATTAMERGGISDEPLKEMVKRSAEDVFLSDLMRTARVMQGGQLFGNLVQMIQAMQGGDGSGLPPQPNDANVLTSQDSINSPVQDRVIADAYRNRDQTTGAPYRA